MVKNVNIRKLYFEMIIRNLYEYKLGIHNTYSYKYLALKNNCIKKYWNYDNHPKRIDHGHDKYTLALVLKGL